MTSSATAASGTSAAGTQINSKRNELKTEDFIKMMVTQLQHQDPLEPAKNQELLAQMSQIGQLQSANTLQEAVKEMSLQNQQTLKSLVLQNQIAAAGNLIGKTVKGLDDQNKQINGIVTAVRVQGEEVFLELDNGRRLRIDQVTSIAGK